MSWLSKILPPKVTTVEAKSNMPEGLWFKCMGCGETLYHTDLENNLLVCPKCNHHHQLSARSRIAMLLDVPNCVEIAKQIKPIDILKFTDTKKYTDRLAQATIKTNEDEVLVVVSGDLASHKVVLACFEFGFIGGSMGSVVGERFVRAVNYAINHKLPFICISASGGARMQEGLNSLMQMTKTCAALTLLAEQGLPFISILTDPTMGGVSASFAFLGDVVIAEPGALIGFAGPRVIEQTVRETLPVGFQRSEFLLTHGAIDMVVSRLQLKAELAKLLNFFAN